MLGDRPRHTLEQALHRKPTNGRPPALSGFPRNEELTKVGCSVQSSFDWRGMKEAMAGRATPWSR